MTCHLKFSTLSIRKNDSISVFDISNQQKVRISYLKAFKDPKIYQLVISCGLRITATLLSQQDSRLFFSLNFYKR